MNIYCSNMVMRERDKLLSPKQARFVDCYANPNGPTFGNATQSYIAAKYKARGRIAQQAACRLIQKNKIKQAIELYQPETLAKRAEINREYAFNKWQELYDRCYADRDSTNCVALIRMVWQQQGLLDNKLVINLEDSRQLEEGHREAARRIGAHLLSAGILDAVFEPITNNDGDEVPNNDNSDNIIESIE